jgi:5-methyltetrahydrofolate--homocysteine methyltransferase
MLEARAVVAFFPANTVDHDDIEVYNPENENQVLGRLHTLR